MVLSPRSHLHDSVKLNLASTLCLESADEGDDTRPLPCNHIFHLVCFDEWVWKTDQPSKCPLRRTDFIDLTQFPRAPEVSHIVLERD
jgi:hypothetical protein